jgi:2-hydroxy-6-oxonona-2,4-dienedioate hydrolase
MPAEEGSVNAKTSPELRWLERGEGDAVVLLHGLFGAMDHWDPTIEALGEMCRVIAPALPILDPALAERSVPELGRHVVRLLETLAIDRAVIGGHALGGHVALEIALTRPDRVAGVILTGSSGLVEHGFTRDMRTVRGVPTLDDVRTRMEEVFYDPTLVTPEWVQAVRQIVTTPATAMRLMQFARAVKRHDIETELTRISVPTLLVWGKEDRITPAEVAERFHALIPDSDLVFITNCGHAPMLERPEAFTEIVEEWLRETASARAPAVRVGTLPAT